MTKPLKPSLRERNRYMTFTVTGDIQPNRKQIVDGIWASLLKMYGEVGASQTSMWVMDWEQTKNSGILKVNHKSVEMLRASMTLLKELNGKKIKTDVSRVCGTLKKARNDLKD